MRIIKHLLTPLMFLTMLCSFCLQCFGAVTYSELYPWFDYLKEDKKIQNFRAFLTESILRDEFLNSYAVISATSDQASERDLTAATYAVNEHFGSEYDHLYMTAAYVSMSLELESGETLFFETAARSTAKDYVTAEISSYSLEGFDQNDKIKDFETRHMTYNRIHKYQIEYDHGQVWRETIVFSPPPRIIIERRTK